MHDLTLYVTYDPSKHFPYEFMVSITRFKSYFIEHDSNLS